MKFKRVYHPVCDWEEMHFNMWGSVTNRKQSLNDAIEFTGNHELYGSFMTRVATEWPISCENALTDNTLNQKAWIGHAACALALQIPEYITRQAWGRLSDEQRFLANKKAERAITQWKLDYSKRFQIHQDMEDTLL